MKTSWHRLVIFQDHSFLQYLEPVKLLTCQHKWLYFSISIFQQSYFSQTWSPTLTLSKKKKHLLSMIKNWHACSKLLCDGHHVVIAYLCNLVQLCLIPVGKCQSIVVIPLMRTHHLLMIQSISLPWGPQFLKECKVLILMQFG